MNNLFKQILNICLFSQFDHNVPIINKNEDFKNYEWDFSFISNDLKGPHPISNIHSSSFKQIEEHIDSTHFVKSE